MMLANEARKAAPGACAPTPTRRAGRRPDRVVAVALAALLVAAMPFPMAAADPDPATANLSSGIPETVDMVTEPAPQDDGTVYRKIEVPAGATLLTVGITNQNGGDIDLYVRFGERPLANQATDQAAPLFRGVTADCIPWLEDVDEECTFENPAEGWWYVAVRPWMGSTVGFCGIPCQVDILAVVETDPVPPLPDPAPAPTEAPAPCFMTPVAFTNPIDDAIDDIVRTVPHTDVECAWFDADDTYLYAGVKVSDIPADEMTTAQVYWEVNFFPDWDPTGLDVGYGASNSLQFRGLRVLAGLIPASLSSTGQLEHSFELHSLGRSSSGNNFFVEGPLPGSSIDADTDIIWFVVPRVTLGVPDEGGDLSGVFTGETAKREFPRAEAGAGIVAGTFGGLAPVGASAVYEIPPVGGVGLLADAGPDQFVLTGETVELNGSCQEGDDALVSCVWSQLTGPAVSLYDDDGEGHAFFDAPSVTDVEEVVLRLTATDTVTSVTDDVTITILPLGLPGDCTEGIPTPDGTIVGSLKMYQGTALAASDLTNAATPGEEPLFLPGEIVTYSSRFTVSSGPAISTSTPFQFCVWNEAGSLVQGPHATSAYSDGDGIGYDAGERPLLGDHLTVPDEPGLYFMTAWVQIGGQNYFVANTDTNADVLCDPGDPAPCDTLFPGGDGLGNGYPAGVKAFRVGLDEDEDEDPETETIVAREEPYVFSIEQGEMRHYMFVAPDDGLMILWAETTCTPNTPANVPCPHDIRLQMSQNPTPGSGDMCTSETLDYKNEVCARPVEAGQTYFYTITGTRLAGDGFFLALLMEAS